jgi:hypothetical protein
MGEIIRAEDDSKASYASIMAYGKPVRYTSTGKRSRPKPIFEVKIHSGFGRRNLRKEIPAHKSFTAINRAILAWYKINKGENPKRLVITIKRKG